MSSCSCFSGVWAALQDFWPSKTRWAIQADDLRRLKAPNPMSAFMRYQRYQDGDGRRLEDDYVLEDKVLGTGMSGSVQLVASTVDGSFYALKTYDKDSMNDSRYQLLKQEVEIYLSVDHPNIARLIDVYEWDEGIALIMELCSGGELQQRWETEAYEEQDVIEATKQMLYAVNYLHAHNICHRDLKLENFLYEIRSQESPKKDASLKLIDFGLSIALDDEEMTMKSTVGTLLYCSPDVISGKAYTSKCDLWSLGVIVFMLLSGRPPYMTSMGHERLRKDISRAKIQWDRLDSISDEARDFVQKLLILDPSQRMDAAAALEHPWLACKVVESPRAQAPHLGGDVLCALKQYMSKSKLQRLLLQLLAQELGTEEAKEMRELFLQIDSDESGTIRIGDLKAAMKRRRTGKVTKGLSSYVSRRLTLPNLSPTNRSSEEAEQIFNMLDANGDDEVHYSDFLAATVNVRGRWRREALRKIFNRIDRDGSGTISVSEVQRIVAETCEDAAAEEFLKEAKVTLNSNGEISFEAFAELFESKDVSLSGTPVSSPSPKGVLKACAWDDSCPRSSPRRKRTESRRGFRRSESEP